MAIRFYMDVHVPQAITDQLRRRGIDVLTAVEDASEELPDAQLLERSFTLERILFTRFGTHCPSLHPKRVAEYG